MTPKTGHWPGFVARVATPATPTELADHLASGWPAIIGGEIPGGCLVACLSQIMLETGTRQIDRDKDGDIDKDDQAPGFWNGNAGNVRGSYELYGVRCWTSFRAGEGFGANEVILEPGPLNKFRSYIGPREDPTDPAVLRLAIERGVRDFLSLLFRKYAPALDAAERKDYHAYVIALHRGGYFTANPSVYSKTEAKLQATIDELPQVAAFLADMIGDGERDRIQGLVGLTLDGVRRNLDANVKTDPAPAPDSQPTTPGTPEAKALT